MKEFSVMQSTKNQLAKILKSAIKQIEKSRKQAKRAGDHELAVEFASGVEELCQWRKKIAAGCAISDQERNDIRMTIKHYYKLSICIA